MLTTLFSPPDPRPTSVRGTTAVVRAKQTVSDGVCRLELADPDGRRLPDWTPGSHIDLVLPGGLVRQYSLCGDRFDAHTYEVAVLREPDGRGGSAYIHDELCVGDVVGIGGPRNNFRLVPADHYLFIAGGIGITPILAMIRAAEVLGVPWSLLYGGRTRASMAFVEELSGYADRVMLCPQDEFGLLGAAGAVAAAPTGTKVYACGPAPLLAAVDDACGGLPAGSLRLERFVPEEQGRPVRSTPFEVELASTGAVVTVAPEESVADALLWAGVPLLTSCRQGVCGTCETRVLDGTPDHRDSLLDDGERGRGDVMFPCVSRSCTDRLVLDL